MFSNLAQQYLHVATANLKVIGYLLPRPAFTIENAAATQSSEQIVKRNLYYYGQGILTVPGKGSPTKTLDTLLTKLSFDPTNGSIVQIVCFQDGKDKAQVSPRF